jgi:hypothetical protein
MPAMAKPDVKPQSAASPNTEAPRRKPIQLDIEPGVWERCHKDLLRKLQQVVQTGHESGDVGIISQIVADLKALDLIEPTRVPRAPEPAPVDPPEIAARKAAASDDAKMQAFSDHVRRKESIDAERSEG